MPLILPLLCLALAKAQDAPLVHTTFASSEGGWMAVQPAGSGGEVSVVHDPASLKVGPGSLRLNYTVASGQVAGAALALADGAVAKMASIHFWVRPDQDAPLVATLQEKGGGRYVAMFSAGKDRWQEVALGVDDFTLSAGEGDPKDPDGKLDADQVDSISILDLDQILAQSPATAGLLGVHLGPRTLYLSDFQVADKPLVGPSAGTEYVFDAYARPQPGWAVLGASASVASEPPLNARSLRLDDDLALGKAAVAFRPLGTGALAGKTSMTLRLAAKNPCQIVVQLEERGGGKYNIAYAVPGGSEAIDRSVVLARLIAAEDSKDANGKLDPDQVGQISIIDITALAGSVEKNTVWIGTIAAKP